MGDGEVSQGTSTAVSVRSTARLDWSQHMTVMEVVIGAEKITREDE